jgi:ubiquinone/menaquinone biosynthesis C-methylase UbiE
MFLRKTKPREPLPITMTGVRMGERLLQVGVDDAAYAGALGAKVGLSGTSAVVVADEASAARIQAAASKAGALVDVSTAPLEVLPYPDAGFDVVVLHSRRAGLGTPAPGISATALRECWRVLRTGGRIVAITTGTRTGLAAYFRGGSGPDAPDVEGPLAAAGFRPVRLVGELEGLRFTEGLKT